MSTILKAGTAMMTLLEIRDLADAAVKWARQRARNEPYNKGYADGLEDGLRLAAGDIGLENAPERLRDVAALIVQVGNDPRDGDRPCPCGKGHTASEHGYDPDGPDDVDPDDQHEDGDGCGIYDPSYRLSVDYDDDNRIPVKNVQPGQAVRDGQEQEWLIVTSVTRVGNDIHIDYPRS